MTLHATIKLPGLALSDLCWARNIFCAIKRGEVPGSYVPDGLQVQRLERAYTGASSTNDSKYCP